MPDSDSILGPNQGQLSQRDLISVFEAFPMPSLLIDAQLRVKLANGQFYRTFQASRIPVEDNDLSELNNGQWNHEKLRVLLEKTINQEVSFTDFDFRFELKNGSQKHFRIEGHPIRMEGSDSYLALVSLRDVTESKNVTADQCGQCDARMARAQRLAHVGDWERNLITNELHWSDEMCRLFGFSPGDARLNYETFICMIHPEDRQKVVELVSKAVRDGQQYSAEYRVNRADGTKIYLHATADVLRDHSGLAIRAIGTAQDVTARKVAEEALQNSQENYRQMADLVPGGIFEMDIVGNVNFVNQYMLSITGYNATDVARGMCAWDLMRPEDKIMIQQSIQDRILGLKSSSERTEYTAVRKDGTTFPAMISGSPILRHGRPIGVRGFFIDITERKQLENQLVSLVEKERKARGLAEEANRSKDQFLSTLSHELRTPLTTILSWAQLLQIDQLDAEKKAHGLRVVEQNAKMQGRIIEDLLDIARIQSGKIKLEFKMVDPHAIFGAALDTTQQLAIEKGIQVHTDIDPKVKSILVDEQRLQQILWNLVSNAIKFSPRGGRIHLELDSFPTARGERIRIRVSDNGKGISPDFLPVIFDRFTQADSASVRTQGGLGLGLAIVKELVALHDANISVESPGEFGGSTFTIMFSEKTLVKIDLENAVAGAKCKSRQRVTDLSGLRVLLVDDSSDGREVLAALLEACGAEVKTADSAMVGLSIFEEFSPHVVVTDIAMPLEDGYSFIRKIRAFKTELGKTPAVALTACARPEDIERARVAGFHAHVSKPFETTHLIHTIASLCGRN